MDVKKWERLPKIEGEYGITSEAQKLLLSGNARSGADLPVLTWPYVPI